MCSECEIPRRTLFNFQKNSERGCGWKIGGFAGVFKGGFGKHRVLVLVICGEVVVKLW
jgi:hypothetical protein